MVDTHAHLSSEEFSEDLDVVLEHAASVGVRAIVVVSQSLADARRVCEICRRGSSLTGMRETSAPALLPAVGLHPVHVASLEDDEKLDMELRGLRQLLEAERDQIVAIGEVGLDFSRWILPAGREEEVRARQRRAFREQLSWATEMDLPVSVHSRSAGHHALTELETMKVSRACLHAFDGRAVYAETAARKLGYFFSIPPSIVRSEQKQKLVSRVPLENLLLETDSPVLGPDVKTRNEPANVVRSLDMIAALRGVDREEIRQILWGNSLKAFPLLMRRR